MSVYVMGRALKLGEQEEIEEKRNIVLSFLESGVITYQFEGDVKITANQYVILKIIFPKLT